MLALALGQHPCLGAMSLVHHVSLDLLVHLHIEEEWDKQWKRELELAQTEKLKCAVRPAVKAARTMAVAQAGCSGSSLRQPSITNQKEPLVFEKVVEGENKVCHTLIGSLLLNNLQELAV